MAGCGCNSNMKFEGLSATYKKVLWIVIAINAMMFIVEFSASFMANSRALQADALDFLGDTLTYTITFLVIGRTAKWRAGAALLKGGSLLLMGGWVVGATLYNVFITQSPNETMMVSVALSAFLANVISALLLMRYREGDANIRSVWLCSRNDAINNLMVIVAAGVVYLTHSHWPDLVAAFFMAAVFLHSATHIIKQAWQEWKDTDSQTCEIAKTTTK